MVLSHQGLTYTSATGLGCVRHLANDPAVCATAQTAKIDAATSAAGPRACKVHASARAETACWG
ncbi:hypothetical protein CERSUDRAFT_85249 [Gelatoporia subvermispora B]|uniref:Uncharacterized protein n=1 Tax=Ceriporiopsis subvermispora (strain B) TaxID=914234 RepID=M2QVL0_CERS8|nr:hypothetical protein CERSUDRAFT_101562 [Gelatoporia subvermispora B]EMD36135.1 hypothetical protein CERSUDRAFT_85249 [Gelatoporia subvermispora B]